MQVPPVDHFPSGGVDQFPSGAAISFIAPPLVAAAECKKLASSLSMGR